MPAIVVERYQTGRYATNAAAQATYVKALERIGQTDAAAAVNAGGVTGGQGSSSALSSEQLQAIGQAVAAQSQGGTIAVNRGKANVAGAGTGGKDAPLYVVVDESRGATIFRWVKFIVVFGFLAYISMVVVMLFVETFGLLKRVGGVQNNEAKPEQQKARFSDVQGCDEAKEELQELVEFLKDPTRFSNLGGKLPKGILLVGPPGTGKTLLARAVAGESGVPFFFMSGSEFDEVYVGVGAKRIRELFNAARAKAPSIIFIDELDAVGGKRNDRDAAYVKQTLNQLLTELDGFTQETGVIIIGATNFPQLLDQALTRPGRFDRNVVVPLPDVRGRVQILKHHMKKVKVEAKVDPSIIARGTPGFSGADLENLVNQAAVHASRKKQKTVTIVDFDWAKDKIMMGAERRSAVIQEKDRIMTAYHEGGHALVALFTPGATPLYKATIMPRGQSLGMTMSMPEMDEVSRSKKQYFAEIDVCMGGKIAEEIIYGGDEVTSGATSVSRNPLLPLQRNPKLTTFQDIHRATLIAYSMVTQMGFSEEIGDVELDSRYHRLSSETKLSIEIEVRRMLDESRRRVHKLLASKRKELDLVARALVEYEVLSKDEMQKVLNGEKLPKISASPNTTFKLPELTLPPVIEPPQVPSGPKEEAGEGEGASTGGPGKGDDAKI